MDTPQKFMRKGIPLPDAPLRGRDFWLMTVAQMEQMIILVLTAAIGVMMPMMKLYYLHTPGAGAMPGVWVQGCVAASGLIGITLGAPLLGHLGDRVGYLWIFRLCALLILLGGLGGWLIDGSVWWTAASLFTVGLGIGGGYPLDEVYLSELMPAKYKLRMIGAAKCLAGTGASWGALLTLLVLKLWPDPACWRYSMMVVALMGAVTLLMRIRWWESPKWLLLQGKPGLALKAAQKFMGPGVVPAPLPKTKPTPVPFKAMFKGQTLWKVIATGVPWALDGVGAYGLGAFLPLVLMGLGLHMGTPGATGVGAVENSVLLTAVLNAFIAVGFAIGLVVLDRVYHIRLMVTGFVFTVLAVAAVMCAYAWHWPAWVGIVAFVVFETALCAGPGIITFVLPSEVYTPEERGTGSGLAASMGKTGAIAGVFFMPLVMDRWGVMGAMTVCLLSMAAGGIVAAIAGPKALPRSAQQKQ